MVKTHQKTRCRTDIIPGLSYPGCHPADGTYISRFNIAGTASAWNLQSTSSSPFEAIDQSFRGDSLQLWNIDFSDLKYAGPCTASAALLQHNCLRITYSMALQLQSVIDPSTSDWNHNIVGDCASTISSPDADEWIESGGIAPFGDTQDQSAYRSKLAGQVKIASFLDALADTDLTRLSTPYHLILWWHLYWCEKSWEAY